MKSEAAVAIGTITAAISAVIVLLRSFGFAISPDQEDALIRVIAILGPLVTGLVIRGFVLSQNTAEEKVEEAHASGAVGGPVPSVKA